MAVVAIGIAGGSPAGPAPVGVVGYHSLIAHNTSRSAPDVDHRFGRSSQDRDPLRSDDNCAAELQLDHHADKLSRRVDANQYLRILYAVSLRNASVAARGGISAALKCFGCEAPVVVIDSYRRYPIASAERVANAMSHATVMMPHRGIGHYGFLVPDPGLNDAVARLVSEVGFRIAQGWRHASRSAHPAQPVRTAISPSPVTNRRRQM